MTESARRSDAFCGGADGAIGGLLGLGKSGRRGEGGEKIGHSGVVSVLDSLPFRV